MSNKCTCSGKTSSGCSVHQPAEQGGAAPTEADLSRRKAMYPSKRTTDKWIEESLNRGGEQYTRFIIRKACDWQRKKDAEICENGIDYPHPTIKDRILRNFGKSLALAKAIREQGNCYESRPQIQFGRVTDVRPWEASKG